MDVIGVYSGVMIRGGVTPLVVTCVVILRLGGPTENAWLNHDGGLNHCTSCYGIYVCAVSSMSA